MSLGKKVRWKLILIPFLVFRFQKGSYSAWRILEAGLGPAYAPTTDDRKQRVEERGDESRKL